MQASPASSQTSEVEARACDHLRRLYAAYEGNPQVRQALLPFLEQYGCNGVGTTTSVTSLPTTTTTFHFDCPLPGGGVGPCPTTTTSFVISDPSTTTTGPTGSTMPPSTVISDPSTTTTRPTTGTTFVPTTSPSTSSTILGTTTTSIHLDCPLPGGGIGPCPTTTIPT